VPSLNTAFPWIGLPAAAVLIALLATDTLRSNRQVSRWHDLAWLSWAGVAAYLLHNVEEYGIDLHGEAYAFPKAFCAMFGFSALYPQCPVPGAVFTAVNVPMFWFAAPLGAWLSKRYPLAGLGIFSVIAVNLVAHIGRAVTSDGHYNPGLLSAIVIFLPLTVWTLIGARLLTRGMVAGIVALGILVHLILMAAMLLLIKGIVYQVELVVALQTLNAALLVAVPLLAEKVLRRTPA
jgi:hypothetical protein